MKLANPIAGPSLSQKILGVLATSTIPIQTPDLIAIVATGMTNHRQRVWDRLRYLERRGLIERLHNMNPRYERGQKSQNRLATFWRLNRG